MFVVILGFSLIFQLLMFRILANELTKELEKFEDRVDEKISLYDKLNQLKIDQEK